MSPTYAPPVNPTSVNPASIAADLRALLASSEPRLRAIPPDVAARPLAPGKWSVQQTVGHLIDSAANNHQRLIRLQLTPALHFPGYAQDAWVALNHYDLLPWLSVLDLWHSLNQHFAHAIEHAEPTALPHLWHINETDPPITLAFLLVDYVAHLRHHLDRLPLPPSP